VNGHRAPRSQHDGGGTGERIAGGFILIAGLDGIRYAIRPQSVGIIHDADGCRDETMVQLHGGHVIRVPAPLDEVLDHMSAWLWGDPSHSMQVTRIAPDDR
jgi:hypothetical protein